MQGKPRSSALGLFLPSAKLSAIVGSQPLSCQETMKAVWRYIRDNKLFRGGRDVACDKKLKAVFGKDRIAMNWDMTGLLIKHMTATGLPARGSPFPPQA